MGCFFFFWAKSKLSAPFKSADVLGLNLDHLESPTVSHLLSWPWLSDMDLKVMFLECLKTHKVTSKQPCVVRSVTSHFRAWKQLVHNHSAKKHQGQDSHPGLIYLLSTSSGCRQEAHFSARPGFKTSTNTFSLLPALVVTCPWHFSVLQ